MKNNNDHLKLKSSAWATILLLATGSSHAGNVVFIDSAVDDRASILAAMPVGSEWHLIDSQHNGLQQIADYLSTRSVPVDALHIVSHAEAGRLLLGNGSLTSDALNSHQTALQSISQALSPNADLLLYGCDLAANAQGRDLVDSLALHTGADVAASVNITRDGDWQLEYQVGTITHASLAPENFLGQLDIFAGDGSGGGGGGNYSAAVTTGGNGGGDDDTITGTANNDVIFGDGSGGGGGGYVSNAGGAGGSGNDTLDGGDGNDIIFGDGFNGLAASGGNGGAGGYGGGGGGGTSMMSGGTGGFQAGNGSSGAGSPGTGSLGGLDDGFGWYGGGGGGWSDNSGAGNGGNYNNPGVAGTNTALTPITDAGLAHYNAIKADVDAGTLDGLASGAGSDIIDGGAGSDDLFGMGGSDEFVFEITDATSADTDTIHDFGVSATADKISLKYSAALFVEADINTLLAAQQTDVPAAGDRSIRINSISPYDLTIVVKGLGRDLVLADFNVGASSNNAPTFTGTPSVKRTGQQLSLLDTGTNDADADTVTLSYQWQRDGSNISGATSASYTLTTADIGAAIRCVISADDGNGGTAVVTTDAINIPTDNPVAAQKTKSAAEAVEAFGAGSLLHLLGLAFGALLFRRK